MRLENVVALLRHHARTTPLPLRRVAKLTKEELALHYAANLPFLLTGLVTTWPALRKWSLAHFARRYGDVVVTVASDREKDPLYDLHTETLSGEMTMRELVKRIPEWLDARRLRGHAALWFGPAGTVTPLHHDQCNILFCQVYGRKRVRMPLTNLRYRNDFGDYCPGGNRTLSSRVQMDLFGRSLQHRAMRLPRSSGVVFR